MDIAALSGALASQAIMGALLTKVLDQSQELIQQQAAAIMEQSMITPLSPDGLGENLDVVA